MSTCQDVVCAPSSRSKHRTTLACFPGDGSIRGSILRRLEQEGPQTRAALAKALDMDADKASKHLGALEQQGRIVRHGRGRYAIVDPVGVTYPRLETLYIATEIIRREYVRFGFDKILTTQIYIDSAIDDGGRHVAACEETGKKILLSPRLATFPEANRLAIVGHEFGHAADFLYPGKWLDDGHGKPNMERWKDRDADEIERAADQIAEAVLRVPIHYTSACLLQSIDPEVSGIRPRPRSLR